MNLFRLFEYQSWADEIIISTLQEISESEMNQQFQGYTTIKHRINHITITLETWYERLNGYSPSPLPNYINETSDKIINIWREFNTKLQLYFSTPRSGQVLYKNSKGNRFSDNVNDIAYHIINHTTAYRHQIVMMLRMMNREVENTDYIYYIRKIRNL